MSINMLLYEKKIDGTTLGIDEAGRGALAGPVVVAGVILKKNFFLKEINDSKKLSPLKRLSLYKEIQKNCISFVSIGSVKEIDEINILQSTLLSMKKIINKASEKFNSVLIDGNMKPKTNINNIKCVIKGDSKSISIAAASIIAKVTRDNMMKDLDKSFPIYHWKQNKGYGTVQHIKSIEIHGLSIHHRRSFCKKYEQYL